MEQQEKKQEIVERMVQIARVTRVTAGGRRFSFRVLVIAGDKKGRVGMGVGKAKDITEAVTKAGRKAIKKMVTIPLQEGTVPFEITTNFKMTKILLKPLPKGRSIIAGGVVRDICELAGIQNINAKILSASKNKINMAKAVFKAFEKMKQILEVKRAIRGNKHYAVSPDSTTSQT